MAKYVRNDIVEAAQWDPINSEAARLLLVSITSKIKKCSLAKQINTAKLSTEGTISIEGLNLLVTIGTNVITACPGEYLVLDKGTLKVMNATKFEAQYKPETPVEDEGTEEAPVARVLRMVKR